MSQAPEDPQTPASAEALAEAPLLLSTERLKAFIDAVVAIAMTLLILPLMESVTEFGHEGKDVLAYLQEDYGQLLSFVLSFLLVANFWITHHRVFARVERATSVLIWLQVAWMFTIVWLPVPTAMLGAMESDALQKTLYIGSLLVTALLMLVTRLYLRRHPELHSIAAAALRRGIAVEIILCSLYALALVVAVLVPAIGYFAMFLMVLSGPAQAIVGRRAARSAAAG
ncbi:TMEM175 family protein [Microbacterium sp. ASV81]|uniref:TMEM175 family protein n=1 Tax=Microbacterium capsulatum TaxID=3041921 RepID=A0ABU0XKL2_9MICO|nr:TMEM175 family protein [Microbacterium sp. ASV81]MDQ4215679.1 TMEM175 family protein [Microbacterium sp. ASV81]